MTTTQLISNLSAIARSRTRQFMKVIEEEAKIRLLINFMLAFQAFLVADKIVVTSKYDNN
jgi:HSP90 family molecular chaperone